MNGATFAQTNSSTSTQVASTERPTYVRAKQIAQRIGVHALTIVKWANEGRIPRYKVSHSVVLFDQAEVLGYVTSTSRVKKQPQRAKAVDQVSAAKAADEDRRLFFRAKELAKKIGISAHLISELGEHGKIARCEVSRSAVLYKEDELYDYIASCRTQSVLQPEVAK